MDARRDIIERLDSARIRYFVTGSEALAIAGIAYRATNDIDIVLDLDSAGYDARLRPSFEPDYLVADLLRVGHRWMGSAIHVREARKADFVIRDLDPWGQAAFARAITIDDPAIGPVVVSTVEDLLVAKLEFADGNLDGMQGRDIAALLASGQAIDQAYIRLQAASLGLTPVLEEALRRARS